MNVPGDARPKAILMPDGSEKWTLASWSSRFLPGGRGGRRRRWRGSRSFGAGAPHAIGVDEDDGEEEKEREGFGGIGEDEGESVHGGMENGHAKKIASGAVVEPSEKDGHRKEEDDADEEIASPGTADATGEVEGGMPQSPEKPDEKASEERRKTLLEAREKEAAPAGFFEGRSEEEIVQKGDASERGGEPECAVGLRADDGAVEIVRERGGDEQNGWEKEKRDGLPGPVRGMDESFEEFADTTVAREGAGKNPSGEHREQSDNHIIEERRRGVDVAELVVRDVDGASEDPKERKG